MAFTISLAYMVDLFWSKSFHAACFSCSHYGSHTSKRL